MQNSSHCHTLGEPGPYCTGTTGLPSDGTISMDPYDKQKAKLLTEDSYFKNVETAVQSADEGDEEMQLLES